MAEDVKLQGRIYPELRIRKTGAISRIQGTFLIVVGLGAMAFFVNMAVGDPMGGGCPLVLALLLGLPLTCLGLSYAGLGLGEWLFALLQRRVWRGPRATVQGQIVDRRASKYWHQGRAHTVLLITFRFESASGPVVLRTEVDEAQYKQLEGIERVKVRYAVENPRLALLEWEWQDEAVSDAGEPPDPDAEGLRHWLIEEYGPPEAPLPDSASGEAADSAVPEPLHIDVLQQVHDAQPATPGSASSPAADRKGVAAIADHKVVAAILRTTIGRVIVGAIVGAILGLVVALPRVDESRPWHRPAEYDAVVSCVIGFAVLGAFMGAFYRLKSSRFRRLADPRVGSGIAGAIGGAIVGAWIALPSKAGSPIDVPELVIWVLGGALVGAAVGIVVYSRRARRG